MGIRPPGARGSCGDPPPIFSFCQKEKTGRGRSKREKRYDERAAHPGRPFVSAGIVRSGLAGVDGPVVPAPDRSREEPGLRITTAVGRRGGKRMDQRRFPLPLTWRLMEAGSTLRQVMGSACRYRCLAAEPHFAVGADFYIRPPLRLSPDSRPAAAGRGADQVGKHPHPSAARSTRQQKPSTVRERARPAGPPGQRVAQRNARNEELRQVRFFTPSLRRGRYAGTRLFARQGKAQGRRGHRRPPDRFARPPYSSKTPQPGHFAALAVFF